jgi:hypothetical protein
LTGEEKTETGFFSLASEKGFSNYLRALAVWRKGSDHSGGVSIYHSNRLQISE